MAQHRKRKSELQASEPKRARHEWNDWLKKLEEFTETKKRLPTCYESYGGWRLGLWCVNQRANKETMAPERFKALESIPGWNWDAREGNWESSLKQVREFVERTGRTPRQGEPGGGWCKYQRDVYRNRKLSPARMAALKDLKGWHWGRDDSVEWWKCLERLREYVARTGRPPTDEEHGGDQELGEWYLRQQQTTLSDAQRDALKVALNQVQPA